MKDHVTIRLKHEQFVEKVCETNLVYSLKSEEGYATSTSNELEDAEGNPVEIICFWSEKEQARVCAKEGWSEYEVVEISLSEFMEDWCIGIDNEELLVGTDFDQNMFGFEIEGYDLILELIEELQANNKEIELQKFADLEDFKNQVNEALE